MLQSLFSGIFAVLDLIFYFLVQCLVVIFLVFKIFIALFQYLFAITGMFLKFIGSFIVPKFSSYTVPNTSSYGLNAVLEVLDGTGMLDILPFSLTCFLWFWFVKKAIGLFGGDK